MMLFLKYVALCTKGKIMKQYTLDSKIPTSDTVNTKYAEEAKKSLRDLIDGFQTVDSAMFVTGYPGLKEAVESGKIDSLSNAASTSERQKAKVINKIVHMLSVTKFLEAKATSGELISAEEAAEILKKEGMPGNSIQHNLYSLYWRAYSFGKDGTVRSRVDSGVYRVSDRKYLVDVSKAAIAYRNAFTHANTTVAGDESKTPVLQNERSLFENLMMEKINLHSNSIRNLYAISKHRDTDIDKLKAQGNELRSLVSSLNEKIDKILSVNFGNVDSNVPTVARNNADINS